MVGRYFDKRRSLASGLALAGGSMGTLLIPQIIRRLIDAFASKGAMLIYSGNTHLCNRALQSILMELVGVIASLATCRCAQNSDVVSPSRVL